MLVVLITTTVTPKGVGDLEKQEKERGPMIVVLELDAAKKRRKEEEEPGIGDLTNKKRRKLKGMLMRTKSVSLLLML